MRARTCALGLVLLLCGVAGTARADQQRDPELRAVVQRAIAEAECFPDEFEAEVWYKMMEPRLRR
ncbi:MAG: lytic transglycosylase domain-containing protein, partial [Gammaproteobacteria bacterium]|nr:lytic transglycosylase domain-containing protein [Gammaproteobacteria bacterium]